MRPSLIIDLDGTLLQTNTFRDYLSFCGKSALHVFRFDLVFFISFWVLMRKVRLVSHSAMKRRLMQRTYRFMLQKGRLDAFVEAELLLVNPRVKEEVERHRNRGHLLVLATAAPAFYAKPIADNMRLDATLATLLASDVVIGEWHENVGTMKAATLQNFLHQHHTDIDAIITDHSDDLPILKLHPAGPNWMVSPSPQTEALLKKENITYSSL